MVTASNNISLFRVASLWSQARLNRERGTQSLASNYLPLIQSYYPPNFTAVDAPKIINGSGKEIVTRGWKGAEWNFDFGFNPQTFAAAVKTYLTERKADIDLIQINDAIPSIGIAQRYNPLTQQTERCLFIPEKLLEMDPGLNAFGIEPPHFTQRIADGPSPISREWIDKLLSLLNFSKTHKTSKPKMIRGLAMRYGIASPGRYFTFDEIGRSCGDGREAGNKLLRKAEWFLRSFDRSRNMLEEMQRTFSSVISWLLESEFAIPLAEVRQALIDLNLVKKGDEALITPLLLLVDKIAPGGLRCINAQKEDQASALPDLFAYRSPGKPLTYIDLKIREPLTNIVKKNVWLCRDYKAYELLLALFPMVIESSRSLNLRAIEEYQIFLDRDLDIPISAAKLKKILQHIPRFFVEEGQKAVYEHEKTLSRFRWLLKKKPLSFRRIAYLSGQKPVLVQQLLESHAEFVIVGRGIYALKDKFFPRLERIPFPDIRRKSWTFAAIYTVLQEAKVPLTVKEIHQELKKRGFKWSIHAVKHILMRDPNHRLFFSQRNGVYSIKS